jgi:hypothetical protein
LVSLAFYLYQLIFLPPTSRAAVGILICVVCCCTLNFFQPHRNRLVLFVSQMSFLMSTFKYVCAVFLRLNDLKDKDRQAMGWVLVLLDVVFMVASVVAFVMVIVLLRAIAGDNATKDNDEVLGEENERSVDRRSPQSMAKVVPAQQQQQQQRSMLQKEIVALKWQKNIRQTLVKNTPKAKLGRVKSRRTRTVEEIERNHQSHRNMAVQNIKQQQVQRRTSLQLRVQARNQKKNAREIVVHGEAAASKKVVNNTASSATVETEDSAAARKWLVKSGVKKTWKFVSKNIEQNKEKKPMLNRVTVVNLFKKLKVVGSEEFVSRQFGTAGNIEPHGFMEWVFEAEIKTATIGVEEIEQAINTVPSSTRS